MQVKMFLSKIHRAIVTHADLHYEGSCTIGKELMKAAYILNYQELHVWNITRGTRLITYAIEDTTNMQETNIICMNGAAAHLNKPGDMVILATFGNMSPEEAKIHKPIVVLVNEQNEIVASRDEVPGSFVSYR